MFHPIRLDRLKLSCWGRSGLVMAYSNGRIEIDNTAVEQTNRLIAINRKNALFANHDTGAHDFSIV